MSGFGITDGVQSLNGQTGVVVDTTAYAIGSFIIGRPSNTTGYSVGSTIAGSSLYSTHAAAVYTGPFHDLYDPNTGSAAQSLVNVGSWRCVSGTNGSLAFSGLWVRYA